MIDPHNVMVDYLLTQSTLTDSISTRIYPFKLPANATLPAIWFRIDGGESMIETPLITPSFEFRCYADTEAEAIALDGLLYDVLTSTIAGVDGNITFAENEVIGQLLPDPDNTRYQMVQSIWSVEMVNE